MSEYRRTRTITDIDWTVVFAAYEDLHRHRGARIDGAIPQALWDERNQEIGRRLGACYVYDDDHRFGRMMFRDEILQALGIYLGYEEV